MPKFVPLTVIRILGVDLQLTALPAAPLPLLCSTTTCVLATAGPTFRQVGEKAKALGLRLQHVGSEDAALRSAAPLFTRSQLK